MDKETLNLFKLAKSGSREAIGQVLQNHEGFIRSVAVKYCRSGMEIDDLIQWGRIGMMRAIEKFKFSKGVSFLTYAAYWVTQSIQRQSNEMGYMIRRPPHAVARLSKMNKTKRHYKVNFNREATLNEYQKKMGMGTRATQFYLDMNTSVVSFEDMLDEEGNSSVDRSLPKYFPDFTEGISEEENRKAIASCLNYMKPRDAYILRMRFGMTKKGHFSLEAIGKMLKITKERVRQIEERSLIELRNKILAKEFGPDADRIRRIMKARH